MNQANLDRKKAWKAAQKTTAKAAFPLSDDLLESLFEFVDFAVGENGCDHSRRFTEEWLGTNDVLQERVFTWLETHGGFCDCEVAGNAMQHWEDNR